MTEHQTVEFKQIWKDEYLKWICGLANPQGGVLVIGRNDAVGVAHAGKSIFACALLPYGKKLNYKESLS